MASLVMRAVAVGATVAVAAAVNVATGMLTQRWTLAWWVATGVLIVVGTGAQLYLVMTDRSGSPANEGTSIVVGGEASGIISTGDGATNTQSR